MNLHEHARLDPRGRALLVRRVVDEGLRAEEAAHAAGVSVRTACKWLRRFREEGLEGLVDRSSRPTRCPHAIPPAVIAQLIERRRARQTYREIAAALDVAPSTTARLLRRAGLHRLAELEPARPDNWYEHAASGDMLHLDIKKPGRFWRPGHRVTGDRTGASDGAGWEFVHLAIWLWPPSTGHSSRQRPPFTVHRVHHRATAARDTVHAGAPWPNADAGATATRGGPVSAWLVQL